MKFLIISHVQHTFYKNHYYGYGPFVKEMNLWLKPDLQLIIVAPCIYDKEPGAMDVAYETINIEFLKVKEFNLTSLSEILKTFIKLPYILWIINKAIRISDHIHIRCPGNMGLLGLIVQIFYPRKSKTAKYAGNWDWKSQQPCSYRLQQRILRNTFITRNMTALIYGDWSDKTSNIRPFFTASYMEKDKIQVKKPDINQCVNLAFVGSLSVNKNPITSLETIKILKSKGVKAKLIFCGDGPERENLKEKTAEWNLNDEVQYLGNVSADTVKQILIESHFLIFISRSEGWPKAVAEAMWWGCIPITSAVSCVPQMLGNGERGFLVDNNVESISKIVEETMRQADKIGKLRISGINWARKYTLEMFEFEIKKLF